MELYNMNDVGYKNYIRGLCLANKPIKFYTREINHISVEDILIIGEENYRKLMQPFAMSKSFVFNGADIDVDLLDVILDSSLEAYQEDLISALSLIFNVDVKCISIQSFDNIHKEIIIEGLKDSLYINSNLFEQLRSIILFINNIKELTQNDAKGSRVKSNNEYNKRLDVFYKGKEEYEKIKSKESNSDIMNCLDYLVHMQKVISYESVLKLNMYQLQNSFRKINLKESCDFNRRIYSSGQVDLKGVEIPEFYKTIINDNK